MYNIITKGGYSRTKELTEMRGLEYHILQSYIPMTYFLFSGSSITLALPAGVRSFKTLFYVEKFIFNPCKNHSENFTMTFLFDCTS